MPLLIHSSVADRRRPRRPLSGLVVCFLFLLIQVFRAHPADVPAPSPALLTNLIGIWSVPKPYQDTPHRIQTEVIIYYYDREWEAFWGECYGAPTWLPFVGSPVSLHAGQRIAIDGVIVPSSDRFEWDKT